jgi:hypothetical protein
VALDPLDTVTGPEEEDVEEPEPTATEPLEPGPSEEPTNTEPPAKLSIETKPPIPPDDAPDFSVISPPCVPEPARSEISPAVALEVPEEISTDPELPSVESPVESTTRPLSTEADEEASVTAPVDTPPWPLTIDTDPATPDAEDPPESKASPPWEEEPP